jgi:hypothetical protein
MVVLYRSNIMVKHKTKKPAPKRQRRNHSRPAVNDRAFYARKEVTQRFGLSDKRLAALVENDSTLPVIFNGKFQIFPKNVMDAWYEAQAAKRRNVHAA